MELNETEQKFRSALNDTLIILEKMMRRCDSLDDLAGIIKLALDNNSQLKMIMGEVVPKGFGQ